MKANLTQISMSKSILTINWKEHIETAYHRMQKRRIRHLPVVNDNGEVIGMLSDRDVQRAMISEIQHEGHIPLSTETIAFDPDALVSDYMGWPVLAIDQSSELRSVAECMLTKKVSALLVQHEGRTVGIITTDDLLKVLVNLLGNPKTPTSLSLKDIIAEAAHRFDGVLV